MVKYITIMSNEMHAERNVAEWITGNYDKHVIYATAVWKLRNQPIPKKKKKNKKEKDEKWGDG